MFFNPPTGGWKRNAFSVLLTSRILGLRGNFPVFVVMCPKTIPKTLGTLSFDPNLTSVIELDMIPFKFSFLQLSFTHFST